MFNSPQRAAARNSTDEKNGNTTAARHRRRSSSFAREITSLEFRDRRTHRGIGKLGLSYLQFGSRRPL
jgi:hypothetical protein